MRLSPAPHCVATRPKTTTLTFFRGLWSEHQLLRGTRNRAEKSSLRLYPLEKKLSTAPYLRAGQTRTVQSSKGHCILVLRGRRVPKKHFVPITGEFCSGGTWSLFTALQPPTLLLMSEMLLVCQCELLLLIKKQPPANLKRLWFNQDVAGLFQRSIPEVPD